MKTSHYTSLLKNIGFNESLLSPYTIKPESVVYMIYWIERLVHNKEEQKRIIDLFNDYCKESKISYSVLSQSPHYQNLVKESQNLIPTQYAVTETVDLIIKHTDSTVLLQKRKNFPQGLSLPGGLVLDEDEENPLGVEKTLWAALRIAAEKILKIPKNQRDYKKHQTKNDIVYSVENIETKESIVIEKNDIYGHPYKENIQTLLRPSDPRHIVKTTVFSCYKKTPFEKTPENEEFLWVSKNDLLDHRISEPFSFGHHKEIILYSLAKTSLQKEKDYNEQNFIKTIINNPEDFYLSFQEKAKKEKYSPFMSFPELFPVVDKILQDLYEDSVNEACQENQALLGLRDKVTNSLRHSCLKNRIFCPYLPTLNAIFSAIAFFDILERTKKEFYKTLPKNKIIEHNPKTTNHASYHMYKYEYRKNLLLQKIPFEIIIPTFSSLSATDLLKLRGTPIRLLGLSTKFIYVDEFEQSPEEFLMHDINHSYRMSNHDDLYLSQNTVPKDEFYQQQNNFLKEILSVLKINKDDSEKTKEYKKIKKIILFEVCHEDAKPCLPEIIQNALIRKEGGETSFEIPTLDQKTGYIDIVDTLDTEISTLSYVRNKLQCGFYDKVETQNNSIVKADYRTSHHIAHAALEFFEYLKKFPNTNKETTPSYETFLKRTCSAGPDNIYAPVQNDKDTQNLNDGAVCLNPKRYLL